MRYELTERGVLLAELPSAKAGYQPPALSCMTLTSSKRGKNSAWGARHIVRYVFRNGNLILTGQLASGSRSTQIQI
jgi:hypothetical protein